MNDHVSSNKYFTCLAGDEWELPRKQIKLITQLGIGEFGPVYDAEVKLVANVTSRALVKVKQYNLSFILSVLCMECRYGMFLIEFQLMWFRWTCNCNL